MTHKRQQYCYRLECHAPDDSWMVILFTMRAKKADGIMRHYHNIGWKHSWCRMPITWFPNKELRNTLKIGAR
jgi:hypothetical protein